MEMNIEKMTIEVDKPKEDEKFICDKCIKDDVCIMSDEYESKETCSSFVPKSKDTRFICNTCRNKSSCIYYGYAKSFIEQNPNNDMKCKRYIKE